MYFFVNAINDPCGTKLKRDYTYSIIMELKDDLIIIFCINNI